MTDLSCSQLCSTLNNPSAFPLEQANFIDTILLMGNVIQLIQLSDTAETGACPFLFQTDLDCFSKIFYQCKKFSPSQCIITVLPPSSDQTNDDATISTCKKRKVSIGREIDFYSNHMISVLIALIIVSILSVVGLLGMFYLRWRLKKAGGWNKFWRTEAQRGDEKADKKYFFNHYVSFEIFIFCIKSKFRKL